MFTVILGVIALADYVIIFYCIVNGIARPTVKTEEAAMGISEGGIMEYINNGKKVNDYIEEQNTRMALLSFNIDKILSNIDSIIERSKFNQRVLLK
jgi:hypothetical protein